MTGTLRPEPAAVKRVGVEKRFNTCRRIAASEEGAAARRARRPIDLCCQATRAGRGETFRRASQMTSLFQPSSPLYLLFADSLSICC